MHESATTYRALKGGRKGEPWTLEFADDRLVARSGEGHEVTILAVETGSRMLVPTFGGKLKYLRLLDDEGRVIELHVTGQVRRVVNDFRAYAHVLNGRAGPAVVFLRGIGLVIAAAIVGAGSVGVMGWLVSQPSAQHTSRGGTKLFVFLLVISLIMLGAGLRLMSQARRIRRVLRDEP